MMNNSEIVTRFAPSPTGSLHIGGARTALFNWLFARGNGGRFLLRIEDTDRERSTDDATAAIFRGLSWLGLDHDGAAKSQFESAARHAEVAHALLAAGKAYKCFATQDEISAFRDAARAEGKSTLFQSPWRDAAADSHPDAPFAIRLKMPKTGETVIRDQVQGDVTIRNDQLDDMILLRSDGTPVYMLAVVVDDHDMGVTHVIRGDDHLNNAARQIQIYLAMDWPLPVYAHIPLIHGPDGKKLSKRHGATGAEEYQALGYPASGMRNYLARLGWSHGDDEVFSDAQARDWFGLDGIGKSPARLDFKKLENICSHHFAQMTGEAAVSELIAFGKAANLPPFDAAALETLRGVSPSTLGKVKTFPDLIDKAEFIFASRPIQCDEKSAKSLDEDARALISELTLQLGNVSWTRDALEQALMHFAEQHDVKFGKLAAPLRAALAGRAATPSVFDMMVVLGRDETLARLGDVS